MQTAIQGLPVTDFPMPAGLVQVAIDSKTGLLPGTSSPAGDVQYDVFVQGTAPTQYSINSAGNSTNGAVYSTNGTGNSTISPTTDNGTGIPIGALNGQ
jgi:membrane carboxypeptidase/penicillin-binding protein